MILSLYIQKEASVNCIRNADFYIPSGIVILSKPDGLSFSNSGDIRVGKFEMLQGVISDARNKALMKIFNLLGIRERAGSGVPRILTVWKEEGLMEPEVDENFKFVRTTLTLSFEKEQKISADKISADKTSANKISADKTSANKLQQEKISPKKEKSKRQSKRQNISSPTQYKRGMQNEKLIVKFLKIMEKQQQKKSQLY